MALHDDLVTDAQAGLFDFEGWVLTEGSAFRLESDVYVLGSGAPMDFTVLSNVVARVYDARDESSVVALTWVPSADGWFALTATAASTAGTAGVIGQNPQRRPAKVTAFGDLPDGRRVQLVDATSVLYIQQKGPTS